MLDFLTRLVQPVVSIRREEWRKTFLMFLYFSFTVSTLYILKPVRNSLFLTAHGASYLRYAYVGEGLFLLFFTISYIALSKRIKQKNIFFSITTFFFITNILLFWGFFQAGFKSLLAYVFYIWVAAYSITIVTQFWTLANDIFNPQEAKRLFGFIISGGSLGGILGGLATNRMAERVGTENLLLFAAGLLLICLYLINLIWKEEQAHPAKVETKPKERFESSRLRDKSTWKLFLTSRYLLLIAAVVGLAKISSAIVDNQFNSIVELSIIEKNARTAFFGGFLAVLNGVSFFMQLVVASKLLRTFGVGVSLLLLPIGLAVGAATGSFMPVLAIAAATKVYDGSFNYSINQMGKEILYLPISRRIRYRVKPLIDMLIYRSSKSVAGLLIIAVTLLLGIPDEKLGIIILILAPFWIMAVWGVRDEYMQAIKKILTHREYKGKEMMLDPKEATEVLANLEGEHSFERLKYFLSHRSSVTRKLSATACLAFYSGGRDMDRVKKLAEEMLRYEALEFHRTNFELVSEEKRHQGNEMLDACLLKLTEAKKNMRNRIKEVLGQDENELLQKLSTCLSAQETNTADKRKAISILTQVGTQGAVSVLLHQLVEAQDHSIRFYLIRALNRIQARDAERRFDQVIIKREALSEIEHQESLAMVLDAYGAKKLSIRPEDDYLLAAFQALQEESLERIFRLLALLYSSDAIHVIYDRLVELESDRHIRANALELLENVVEPEISRRLKPILDNRSDRLPGKKSLDQTIGEFLRSKDRWLEVCTVFFVAELNLKQFYDNLKTSAHSGVPIVKEAAEIALLKIDNTH
jgi:ATP/ADP translocase